MCDTEVNETLKNGYFQAELNFDSTGVMPFVSCGVYKVAEKRRREKRKKSVKIVERGHTQTGLLALCLLLMVTE